MSAAAIFSEIIDPAGRFLYAICNITDRNRYNQYYLITTIMEDDKKKTGSCCSCEADFQKEIKNLEEEAQKPTAEQHEKKQSELDSAFKEGEK